MDSQLYMIVDLERCGDKCMFITEQVSSISENKNGLWAVRFSSSTRVFNYNKARLLYFTDPETMDFSEKDCISRISTSAMWQKYCGFLTLVIHSIE